MEKINTSERRWGRWYLSKSKPLILNINLYDHNIPFKIALSEINNSDKILHWINHLIQTKANIDKQAIRDLMRACRTLQDEGSMPSGGPPGNDDWGY